MRCRSPRQLWSTFRRFTATDSTRILCSPDDQWTHWAGQGDVHEDVWTHHTTETAERWASELRNMGASEYDATPITHEEMEATQRKLKTGRAPGKDGIPAEISWYVPGVFQFVHLLFNNILRTMTYPTEWGIALVRSLLKPGKPADSATSLRGLRLLCTLAGWLSKVLDRQARQAWQACPQQFGTGRAWAA